MRMNRWIVALSLGLVLAAAAACNVSMSTANLSSLKLAKDKAGNQPASTFATEDTIYGIAVVSNAPSKVKVKASVSAENVPGQQTGPIPGLDTTLDLDGSGTATFTYTPPSAGWPKGTYKVDVVMLNEAGEQKDQKTATFTVS